MVKANEKKKHPKYMISQHRIGSYRGCVYKNLFLEDWLLEYRNENPLYIRSLPFGFPNANHKGELKNRTPRNVKSIRNIRIQKTGRLVQRAGNCLSEAASNQTVAFQSNFAAAVIFVNEIFRESTAGRNGEAGDNGHPELVSDDDRLVTTLWLNVSIIS